MQLYFSPLACSMASRIALYEAGGDAVFLEVDPRTKRVLAGNDDFCGINPLGLVPTLRTDDGAIITENAAILQYIAERFPDAALGAQSPAERARLQQWLAFFGTELHKGLFIPLLAKDAPEGMRSWTLNKYRARLDYLNGYLQSRDFVLDHFSVADGYLVTILNWTTVIKELNLSQWPSLQAYYERLLKRPSIAKAIAEELPLYRAELVRHKAA